LGKVEPKRLYHFSKKHYKTLAQPLGKVDLAPPFLKVEKVEKLEKL